MADLGIRGNVMGPQPIAQRQPLPPEMFEAAERVIAMFERGDVQGLAAISVPAVVSEVRTIASNIAPGRYTRHEIIAAARVIHHHYRQGADARRRVPSRSRSSSAWAIKTANGWCGKR